VKMIKNRKTAAEEARTIHMSGYEGASYARGRRGEIQSRAKVETRALTRVKTARRAQLQSTVVPFSMAQGSLVVVPEQSS